MFLTRFHRKFSLIVLAFTLFACGNESTPDATEAGKTDTTKKIKAVKAVQDESFPASISFAGGNSEGVMIGGFFEPDPELAGRWMGKEAFVLLHVPPHPDDTFCFIRLTGLNFRPDSHVIRIRTADGVVGELENPQKGTSYTLWSKPLQLPAGSALKIFIAVSSTYRPANHDESDERLLGTVVEDVSIMPAPSRSLVNFARPSEYLDVPLSGMYAPEPGLPGRWTGMEMGIFLKKPEASGKNFRVVIHGINYRSDTFHLLLDIEGKQIADFQSPGSGEPFVFVANCSLEDRNPLVRLHLKADPVFEPWKHGSNDRRPLGVFLESLELRPATYPGCVDFRKTDVDLVAVSGIFPEEEGLEDIGRWIGPEAVLKLSVPAGKRVFHSLILEGTNYRIDDFLLSAEINGESVYSFHPPQGKFSIRTPILKELEAGSVSRVVLKVRPAFNSEEAGGRQRILGVVMGRVCLE